jgi:hypothetical protein
VTDKFKEHADTWGFPANEHPYLKMLVDMYGPDEGVRLLDRLFTTYGLPESFRTAVRTAWGFRSRTSQLLRLSPEALEAAVRFVVRSAETGMGLHRRQAILERYLRCWGLDDRAAEERAETQLLALAGAHVSDDQVLKQFMAARVAFVEAIEKRVETAEARAWLTSNPNPLPFALNRFHEPGSAAKFVEALYHAGATRVVITNISYAYESTVGGPSSHSIDVHLPRNRDRRAQVFEVINTIGRPEDRPITDDDKPTVGLWWD